MTRRSQSGNRGRCTYIITTGSTCDEERSQAWGHIPESSAFSFDVEHLFDIPYRLIDTAS